MANSEFYIILYGENIFILRRKEKMLFRCSFFFFFLIVSLLQDFWLGRRLGSPSRNISECMQLKKWGVLAVGGDRGFPSTYPYTWSLYTCILCKQSAHIQTYLCGCILHWSIQTIKSFPGRSWIHSTYFIICPCELVFPLFVLPLQHFQSILGSSET